MNTDPMEMGKLAWKSSSEILSEISLEKEERNIINYLDKIQSPLCNNKLSKQAKTILIKLTLSICGDGLNYKVYSNQIKPKKRKTKLSPKTKGDYRQAYAEIKRTFHKHRQYFAKFKNKEWLWDIHWYADKKSTINQKYDKDLYCITTLNLVGEIELSNSIKKDIYWQVRYDFQKLLVADATLRLMIFRMMCLKSDTEKEKRFNFLSDYFINAINSFEQLKSKSRLLFVVFDEQKKGLLFSIYQKS